MPVLSRTQQNAIHQAIQRGGLEPAEALFMCGPDIDAYLRELHTHAVKLYGTHHQLEDRPLAAANDRDRVADENAATLLWFTEQLGAARERFGRHLRLA